ncbi:MAG TPA: DUF4845 domain-containing protein [Gammaproteobacteria bacterium]|nr:DUF4845 domain-containing protein [Gammaproteobacteria bacterium]
MKKSKHHQTGLTLISWIVLIMMFAFIFWFGFCLFPIYMQYYSINSVVQKKSQEITVGEMPLQILHSMDMTFTINGVQDPNLTPEKVLTIAPSDDGKYLIFTLDYDARNNFIGNIDLFVHFHKTYQATPH